MHAGTTAATVRKKNKITALRSFLSFLLRSFFFSLPASSRLPYLVTQAVCTHTYVHRSWEPFYELIVEARKRGGTDAIMSEVLQLFEMHADVSTSKEFNERRRQEAIEASLKITDLEERLEEKVSVTDRHREKKKKATAALQKRVQAVSWPRITPS